MKMRRHSDYYNFIGDTESGMTFRWGKTFDDDPVVAPWPELVDISISNHCTKQCDYCYRDSTDNCFFMNLEDYEYILKSFNHSKWGNVFQVALGGGEPLEHPQFIEIIKATIKYNVIPNFTTNGIKLSPEIIQAIQGKIGAMALSTYDLNTLPYNTLSLLKESSVKTNLHFLLSKKSIKQAIQILKGNYNHLLDNLNAIIFLTYKPTGRANATDCLQWNDELRTFVQLINNHICSTRIGFDACFVPMLLHTTNIATQYIDPCECAFFSVYIDEKLNVKPCSFTNCEAYTFNIKEYALQEIWAEKFAAYRKLAQNDCRRDCGCKDLCRGRCIFFDEINFCYSHKNEGSLLP